MEIDRGVGGVKRKVTVQKRGVGGVNRNVVSQIRGVGGVNRAVFQSVPPNALYWLGNECIDKTGGWQPYYINTNYTFTKQLSSIYLLNNTGGWLHLYPQNRIDLTNYTKLWVTISSLTGTFAIGVNTNGGLSGSDVVQKEITTIGTYYIDITNCNSLYYINLQISYAAGSNVTISKVWLE